MGQRGVEVWGTSLSSAFGKKVLQKIRTKMKSYLTIFGGGGR